MPKILVPIDFSAHSKAGIRFALQWSTQQDLDLVFIHISNLTIYTLEKSGELEAKAVNQQNLNLSIKLNRFVAAICKTMKIERKNLTCLVRNGISAHLGIIDYCRDHGDIDYICMSTGGAKNWNQIFGTNTGNLITHSEIPVLAVPTHYRRSRIRKILYASDLLHYRLEFTKVLNFARPLKAKISVIHLSQTEDNFEDRETMLKSLSGDYHRNIELQVTRSRKHQLLKQLQDAIVRSNPSLVVLFTDQNEGLLKKIISPSKTERLSFEATVPLLTFHK